MAFGLRMRKTPKKEIDRRVREAAELLGISHLLQRKPHSLSGGQRQRVAVGRAIVRQPACFLFDEPLSNLDVKMRLQMRGELKALHMRLKTTAVYVTHDQEEAMTLGDRIAVMADGEIQQVGRPLDVYRSPVNRFVAGFVGLPPMNFIDGDIATRDGVLSFRDRADLVVPLPDMLTSAGAPAVLGIRPEALRLAHPNFAAAGHVVIRASVRVVEPLGDRQDVFATTPAGDAIIARIDAEVPLAAGQSAAFTLRDAGAIHLFEQGDFGRRIQAANESRPA
jgi:multiple sugar transport system ATP-binding protein